MVVLYVSTHIHKQTYLPIGSPCVIYREKNICAKHFQHYLNLNIFSLIFLFNQLLIIYFVMIMVPNAGDTGYLQSNKDCKHFLKKHKYENFLNLKLQCFLNHYESVLKEKTS